jgi:WD40 repeat protein
MEYKGDEQPSLNNAGQPHSTEHMTVPASFLPSVLSRLGLGDATSVFSTVIDNQLDALKDEEISARVAAVRNIEEQREANAIESLLAALHDSAWEVRAAAVWALGKFGEQAPLEALMRATDDEDGSVRAAALRTLDLIGDRALREPLIRGLDDPDWQVREVAVLILGELGEHAPLEPLVAGLNDEHAGVREATRFALEQSHPEALSTISIDPMMITQESASNTASTLREQEQPGTGVEVEARVKASSNGVSMLNQFTIHVRTLLSKVVQDVVTPLADAKSILDDDGMSDVIVNEPVQTKPRRLRHIAEGILAALIIAGLVASWLAIEQRLHPSQGSASTPLLVYHGHVVGPAVWSSDSKYVSFIADSTPSGETVFVWNKATGQVTKHILRSLQSNPQENQTVFAPDGKHLAFVERNTNNEVAVQVWDVVGWRNILTTYHSSPSGYLNVYWSTDNAHIVIPVEDGTMQVWNVVTGQEVAVCHVTPVNYLPQVSYLSPDGQRVLFGYGPQHMYVLDLTTCKLLILPSTDANAAFWSPQGDRFATNSLTDANMVQVWDARTGRNLASFHLSAPVSDSGLVWTSDGTRLVTWGNEVNVLDVTTQRIVLKVIPTRIDLLPVWALSPDARRIASLSGADTVQVWDAVTGRKLNVYQSPRSTVKVVAWSPDNRTIATGSTDGTVRVWHADTAPQTYHSGSSAVLNIVWSPDGKSIAAGDLDGNIRVWQVRYSGT